MEQIGARRDVPGLRALGWFHVTLGIERQPTPASGAADYRTPTSASEPFTMGWQCELNDPCHAADTTVERTVRRLIESPRGGRACAWLGPVGDRPHGWPKIEV